MRAVFTICISCDRGSGIILPLAAIMSGVNADARPRGVISGATEG
jgi:hypothetical protein